MTKKRAATEGGWGDRPQLAGGYNFWMAPAAGGGHFLFFDICGTAGISKERQVMQVVI